MIQMKPKEALFGNLSFSVKKYPHLWNQLYCIIFTKNFIMQIAINPKLYSESFGFNIQVIKISRVLKEEIES